MQQPNVPREKDGEELTRLRQRGLRLLSIFPAEFMGKRDKAGGGEEEDGGGGKGGEKGFVRVVGGGSSTWCASQRDIIILQAAALLLLPIRWRAGQRRPNF